MIAALLMLDLLERDGDGFCNAADVERFLVEDKRSYAGFHLGTEALFEAFLGTLGRRLGEMASACGLNASEQRPLHAGSGLDS